MNFIKFCMNPHNCPLCANIMDYISKNVFLKGTFFVISLDFMAFFQYNWL
jgi:hypothetical protein